MTRSRAGLSETFAGINVTLIGRGGSAPDGRSSSCACIAATLPADRPKECHPRGEHNSAEGPPARESETRFPGRSTMTGTRRPNCRHPGCRSPGNADNFLLQLGTDGTRFHFRCNETVETSISTRQGTCHLGATPPINPDHWKTMMSFSSREFVPLIAAAT